ncbi:cyclin domain-containing protein [Loa loa]|uniref:Cyclin domain-containing protein n=1 Tax=Loa loa TaxID=7209 RepID=A0A1S0U5N3_LOALO|nr:cyclin domain-containing protein [Loa loa]EFO25614.1 cyclin domain-containing protein [Loa loa]
MKRRSLSTKRTQFSESSIKYRRITEENCRSAKIIENERRLSDNPLLPSKSSTGAPDVCTYNDPSNFLSCGCLGSPREVWHVLCDSQNRIDERRAGECKRTEVKGIHLRITTLLVMMQLCEYMECRRETYHRAMDLFDRLMAVFDFENMDKGEIIFTGIFVVFIASKIEERRKNHWRIIADYIRQVSPCGRLETENIFEMEMKIIAGLHWSLRTVTALEWAKIYMHMTRVYTIYKRIRNLSLAHQSTPTRKRTRITLGVSDDEEVDLFTWAQLDDLVIGEPSFSGDWNNRIAIAQVLDLCTLDLYSFNFTYRQLGAAACVSVLGLNYEIAVRITGFEKNDLYPAVDFVNSYRRIYMKHVHKEGVNLAIIREDDSLHSLEESEEDEEIEVMKKQDEAPRILESTQNVKNRPIKMLRAKIMFSPPKSFPKNKPSHETLQTSGVTNEMLTKKKRLPTTSSPVTVNTFSHPPPPKTQALPLQVPIDDATSATNKATGRCTEIIEMECECGCGKRDIIDDKLELKKMINSLSHQKGKGKTVAKLFISRRNQQGETKRCREIAVPHPIEVMEKQMRKFYTQSFPLAAQMMHRITERLQQFWLMYENRQPCRRRHSHSVWQNRRTDVNQQRRESR